jgi:hypothetical protein
VTRTIGLLSLVFLLTACSAEADPAAGTPGDATLPDALAAPLAKASETGRSLLVLYTKEGCNCCAHADEVLADPEVVEMLGKMEFVRLTKDKDAGEFEKAFADAKAPAFVVYGPDGEPRGPVLNGPFDTGEFLALLDWVVEPDGAQPELIRYEDACGGCAEDEGAGAAADEGCGGCGEEETSEPKVVDEGCSGGG